VLRPRPGPPRDPAAVYPRARGVSIVPDAPPVPCVPGVFTPGFPYAPQSSQRAKSSQVYPGERGLERGESGLRRARGGDQRHGEADGHARHHPSDALAAVRLVTGDHDGLHKYPG